MAEPAETVSIIIPTYFRNDTLREAVESALDQEYDMTEVIIVDDSGEGHAEPVANEYESINYVPLEQNRGANRAREAGLDVATGTYIQFLDDDDRLHSEKISAQIQQLDEQTGVVYSGFRRHESGEVVLPDPTVHSNTLKYALKFDMWPPCCTDTMLIDRHVLEQVRPLRYSGAGDTYFIIGLALRTEFDFVNEPLVDIRCQSGSLGFSLKNSAVKKQLLAEYEESYDKYPDCRATALTHIYSQEGHVRLTNTVWSPQAILSFARAAYYSRSNRILHIANVFGSLFGRSGMEGVNMLRKFAVSCRDAGPVQALRRAYRSVLSQ